MLSGFIGTKGCEGRKGRRKFSQLDVLVRHLATQRACHRIAGWTMPLFFSRSADTDTHRHERASRCTEHGRVHNAAQLFVGCSCALGQKSVCVQGRPHSISLEHKRYRWTTLFFGRACQAGVTAIRTTMWRPVCQLGWIVLTPAVHVTDDAYDGWACW